MKCLKNFIDLVCCGCLYLSHSGTFDEPSINNNMQTRIYFVERKRLLMEVVQYHGNLRAQVSKLSRGSSLSKISLIFWTCCAGRIRY